MIALRIRIGLIACFALIWCIAPLQSSSMLENKQKLVTYVWHVGHLLGEASSCQDIPKYRISNIYNKVVKMLEKGASSSTEKDALIDILDAGQTEGVRSTVKTSANCTSLQMNLAEFESANERAKAEMSAEAPSAPPVSQQGSAQTIGSQRSSYRGITDTEIRFGISAPFTGSARDLSLRMQKGIDIAFKQANETGGLYGRMLKLISADDGDEPAQTAETVRQLYEKDQVFGFIGNVGTPNATVSLPFALEHRMLFFAPFTGANLLRKQPPDRYVFNYRPSYSEETAVVVRYLMNHLHLKPEQIAVFAQEDSYGDTGYAEFEKAVATISKGDVKKILRIGYKRNTVDVDRAIAKLKASKTPIKAVMIVGTYRAAAQFIKKTTVSYPGLTYASLSFVGTTLLRNELMALGSKYPNGVIVTNVVPPIAGASSLIQSYKDALNKVYPGDEPDSVSLEGYISGRILIEALKRAGADLTTDKVVDVLEDMHDLDIGLGSPVGFGKSDHQGSHKVWATLLDQQGNYKPLPE